MLEIRPDGSLKVENELRICFKQNFKSVLDARERSDFEKILKLLDNVYKRIGKIYDKKK